MQSCNYSALKTIFLINCHRRLWWVSFYLNFNQEIQSANRIKYSADHRQLGWKFKYKENEFFNPDNKNLLNDLAMPPRRPRKLQYSSVWMADALKTFKGNKWQKARTLRNWTELWRYCLCDIRCENHLISHSWIWDICVTGTGMSPS